MGSEQFNKELLVLPHFIKSLFVKTEGKPCGECKRKADGADKEY